jgi:putative MATE family efflux protein
MTGFDIARDGLARTLFRMTWPMIFGVLALLGFQLVDSIFISRLGVDPLAALGFTVPVYQLIIGTQVGIGIATTALISRALGAGESARAYRLGGLVLVTGGVIMLALCLVVWLLRAPLLDALGADPRLLSLVSRFWIPWLASAWVGAILYFGYSIARANGDTRLPGLLMVATSLINLVLDPLFIFTFGWGMPGAALATLVAFGVGAAIMFRQLRRRAWLRFDLQALPPGEALRQLGGISGPAMFGQLMPGLAASFATALIAGFGAAAVAAWALATRMEFFSLVVVLALTMSMPPMVGRLVGAGEIGLTRALVRLAVRFVLGLQLSLALIWLVASGTASALLAPQPAVASVLTTYLALVPLSYGALGVCMLMVSVCNALGLPLWALLISCLRLFVCYLPALWLGAHLAGLEGAFAGALAGNLAAGGVAFMLYRGALAHIGGSRMDRAGPATTPADERAAMER